MLLEFTAELRSRKRPYSDPHLPFYSQQSINPDDFYFTLFRNPINMLISFFNYVAQRHSLPPHAKCNIGWEAAFKNKKTPLQFAKRHYDVTEGDFLHFFLPTVPNASAVLRAWPAYKAMQLLPPSEQVVRKPWISNFPRNQYLQYLSENVSVFPDQYRCEPYVEASVLLLERYAAVGTLEKLSNMYAVLYHRAKINEHVNVSHVSNRSFKVMPVEVETEVKVLLKETMFCQTLMWKMAAAINTHDLRCMAKERAEV
jgi:hypothetical protein